MATLTFNQTGIPAGVEDRSRSDGQAGKTVTVTASEAGELELLWTPLDDQLASLTRVNASTWTFGPAPGVAGSYLVRFTPTSGGQQVRRIFSIRTPKRHLRKPALNERASPLASLLDADDDKVVASDFNEADPDDGSPFVQGNYGGWYCALIELFNAVEAIEIPEPADVEPPSQLTIVEEGPLVVDLGNVPNRAYLQRVDNEIIGTTPAGGSSGWDFPLTMCPTAEDTLDEFDGGSADLAQRGWTVISETGAVGQRIGDIEPWVEYSHPGDASFSGDNSGMNQGQYRSTIVGSTLFIQAKNPLVIYKTITDLAQDELIAAKFSMSSYSRFDENGVWSTGQCILLVSDQPITATDQGYSQWNGVKSDGQTWKQYFLYQNIEQQNNPIPWYWPGDTFCVRRRVGTSPAMFVMDSKTGHVLRQRITGPVCPVGVRTVALDVASYFIGGGGPHYVAIDWVRRKKFA